LASLQASAVPDGDDYIVNGTKIWTSLAQHADWIFCLLRTDNSGKKQEGITFLLIDMATPGITVKPIITIDGKHSLNQVEFVDVRVPQKNRIGEEGKGWTYANYLLGHERTSYAHVAGKRKQLRNIREVAKKTEADGTRLINDPAFVTKLSALEARLDALELTVLRVLASVADGGAPGEESSILKVIATELAQDITELGAEAFGPYAQPAFADSVVPEGSDNFAIPAGAAPSVAQYLGARAQSIYGGSNEIQKNIIAKRILGL
jgi:alkylation response protein AidB-like acyl-CoA dehydrogenase